LVVATVCFLLVPNACWALESAVDAVQADFVWQQGYTGAGVEIGVIDLFLADSSHPALSGNYRGSQKFVNGAGWLGDHGTAVAGAAVSQDPGRLGVAFDAGWWTAQTTNRGSITNQRTQTVAAETFARGLGDLGGDPVEVLTLSISLGGGDAAVDQWSLGLDHIVAARGTTVIVAAGNDGPTTSTFSGPPATAFNILSVGATGGTGGAISNDYTQIAPYSSRGPTGGGRAKPDIVAPGSLLELPTLGGGWSEGSGTSFAAPLVAGGAALLIDMGRDRGLDVDALVIKGVLMNSADKLAGWSHTSTTPLDVNFGAGQMNLESAFHQYAAGQQGPGTVETTGWDHGTILGGLDNLYNIVLDLPTGSLLTATLVWNREATASTTDVQTAVYAASPLVNLDLFLSPLDEPDAPVASSVSTIDNVEHLFLPIPSHGRYVLGVRNSSGTLVDPLSYSLAWNVDVTETFLAGDFNEDTYVDDVDLDLWKSGFGTLAGATHLQGDADGDLDVDGADFLTWQRQVSGASTVGTHAAVPEPSSVILFLMGIAALGVLNWNGSPGSLR
jgi:hypothetical protein